MGQHTSQKKHTNVASEVSVCSCSFLEYVSHVRAHVGLLVLSRMAAKRNHTAVFGNWRCARFARAHGDVLNVHTEAF